MIMRFIPYLMLILIALLMKTPGLIRVLADLVMLLIPIYYIWKRQLFQVFHVSGNLLVPVHVSIWSVNTAVFFDIHDFPGREASIIGAIAFLVIALLSVSMTKDKSILNDLKKETLSLNIFLYYMVGSGIILQF
jgi:uncharacterized membrane protein